MSPAPKGDVCFSHPHPRAPGPLVSSPHPTLPEGQEGMCTYIAHRSLVAKLRLKWHLLCQCLRLPGPGQSPSQLLTIKSGEGGGGGGGREETGALGLELRPPRLDSLVFLA